MRALFILMLFLSRSLCEEHDSVRVIHDYHDPAAETWEIHVHGSSRIVVDEESERVSTFDFGRLETHAKSSGMPVAFFFHPEENDLGEFAQTLISFFGRANRFSLKYTATLVVPGKSGITLKTSITRPDSYESLVIGKNFDQWIFSGKTITIDTMFERIKTSKGELAITINREAFKTMKSIDVVRDLISTLNKCDHLGNAKWIYSITIN